MALNLPASPTDQQTYTDITSGVTYVYYATPGVWKRAAAPTSSTTQQFIADGNTSIFQLSANVANPQDVVITLNGLVQFPPSHYSLIGNSTGTFVNFTTTPFNGEYIEIRTIYGTGSGATTGSLSGSTLIANNLVIKGNITAGGSNGATGQVLTTNGTALYWANGAINVGFTGSRGPQGYQGPAGGYTGSIGFAGSTGYSGSLGSTGFTGSTGPSKAYSQLYQPGVLNTTVGVNRWYTPANVTINSTVARVVTAPQGSNTVIYVKKNGTVQSIINITPGSTSGANNSININMSDLTNDYITVDVATVGYTYPGSDLNVIIKYLYI